MKWFRLYHELPHDRKLRKFSSAQKWAWIVLLCLASESKKRGFIMGEDDDVLAEDCGFDSTQDFLYFLDKLRQQDMITPVKGGIKITHWDDRQFVSDDVTARTSASKAKAKKERSQSVPRNVPKNVPLSSSDTDPYSDPEAEKEIKEVTTLASSDLPDEMVDPLIRSTMPARPLPTVEHSPGFSKMQFMEFFQWVMPDEAMRRQNKDACMKKFMSVQGVDYKTFKECYKKFVKAYEEKNPNEKKGEKYQYLKGLPRWIDEEGWLEFIPEHLRGGSLNLEMVIAGLPRSFKRETYMILPDGDWRVNASLCSPEELAAFSRGSYKPESYRRIREFELPAFLEQNPGVIHVKDVLAVSGKIP